MDSENMTVFMGTNTTDSPIVIRSLNIAIALLMWASFLVGATINGIFLWVLGVKMKKTVNILWYHHLILTYLIFCLLLPLSGIYALLGFHWPYGIIMCKLVNSLGSLAMFTMVFLLTFISLDRYVIVCHPIWSQQNRTIRRAQRLIVGVWFLSLVFSAPYLVFRETRKVEKGRVVCINNYVFSTGWKEYEAQIVAYRIQLALFIFRFLLAFLFPFFIIMACSYWTTREMKKRRIVKKSVKPFRILVTSVASFFISYFPYHLYYASLLIVNLPEGIHQIFWTVMATAACFNFCFTPILYLFVGEKFQQVFKTSIVALLQKGFMDAPILFMDHENPRTEGHCQQQDLGAEGDSREWFATAKKREMLNESEH